jgi:hypothetical protein
MIAARGPQISWRGNAPVIAGLLAKRATIESEIVEREREIRRHRSELMQIDATILLFAPDLRRAKPGGARSRRTKRRRALQ